MANDEYLLKNLKTFGCKDIVIDNRTNRDWSIIATNLNLNDKGDGILYKSNVIVNGLNTKTTEFIHSVTSQIKDNVLVFDKLVKSINTNKKYTKLLLNDKGIAITGRTKGQEKRANGIPVTLMADFWSWK